MSPENENGWISLGRPSDVGIGEHLVYQTDHGPIIIVNLDGEFYALDDVCTHDGGILSDGWLKNGELVCPRHGAHFCVKSGEATQPPAYEPINTYPVRVANNVLQIKI